MSEPDCLDERSCRWVWELTQNAWLSEASSLTIVACRVLLIIIAALVIRWLVHRAIRRMVNHASSNHVPAVIKSLPKRVRHSVQEATGSSAARRMQRAAALGSVLRSAATVAVFAVAGLLILSEFDVNLAPLLAGAGIVGVALGFGAQSLVRDVLAGLFMLLEDQYGVGDLVDLGEASGEVIGVGLRITTVRDIQGVLWHVPNGEVRRVGNRSHTPAVVVVDIPIGFAPVAEAVSALRIGAQRLADDPEFRDAVLEPPELLGVQNVTVEGAVFRTTINTTAAAQWQIGRELRRRQTEALQDAGLTAQVLAARVYPREPGPS